MHSVQEIADRSQNDRSFPFSIDLINFDLLKMECLELYPSEFTAYFLQCQQKYTYTDAMTFA